MKIQKLEIENFKGYKGHHDFYLPHICALTSHNGTGKTSLLDAIRFVAGGVEPEGNILHNGTTKGYVAMTLESGNVYMRIRQLSSTGLKGTCKINGNTTTKKDFEKALEDELQLSIESIENVMSADIFKSLNPKDFGKFILGYIPEKLTKETIISYIPNSTIGMIDIVDLLLPEDDITTDVLDDLCETLKETRKGLNAKDKALKALIANFPEKHPEKSVEELEERQKNLLLYERNLQVYTKEMKEREAIIVRQKQLSEKMKALETEISGISATRPNPDVIAKILEDKAKANEAITAAKSAINAAETSNRTMEQSIKALSSNVCPFSGEIKCSTDKSSVINGIKETMEVNRLSAESQKKILAEKESLYTQLVEQETAYRENEKKYTRKCLLQQNLDSAKKMVTDIPDMPEKPETVENFEAEKAQVSRLLKAWTDYNSRKQTEEVIKNQKKEIDDYGRLVKAFDKNGEVIKKVLDYYSEILDEAVNTNAASVRNGLKLHFNPDGGLKIQADTGNGFISYESLSMGERTDVIYLVIDLINQLSGSKILLLDETSVLDEDSYRKLIQTIVDNKDNYDHIILSGVNNNFVLDEFQIPSLQEN